ncbi:substrate-binding periplasmic protein [Colwelliaceae bacterium 6471]
MMKILFIQCIFFLCFSLDSHGAKYVFVSSEFASIAEQNTQGELSGLGVDIVRKVAEDLDIDIEIKIYPFNRMIYLMQDKLVDAAFGIYKNQEREKFMDYLDVPFFNDSYLFYTNNESQLNWDGTMNSFPKDKTFCWVRGWSYFEELNSIKNQIRLNESRTLAGCLDMLVGKRFDLLAGPIRDIVPLIKAKEYENQVQLIAKHKGLEGNYIAFPKGHLPALQQSIRQSLTKILNSQWYEEKLQQYGLNESIIN